MSNRQPGEGLLYLSPRAMFAFMIELICLFLYGDVCFIFILFVALSACIINTETDEK